MRLRGGYGRGYYSPVDITALSDLNLTDEQTLQLKKLRHDHLLEMNPIQNQMYDKTLEVKRLWLEPAPVLGKIGLLQKEINMLQDEMIEKNLEYREAVRTILTEQQYQQFLSVQMKYGCVFGRGRHAPGEIKRKPFIER